MTYEKVYQNLMEWRRILIQNRTPQDDLPVEEGGIPPGMYPLQNLFFFDETSGDQAGKTAFYLRYLTSRCVFKPNDRAVDHITLCPIFNGLGQLIVNLIIFAGNQNDQLAFKFTLKFQGLQRLFLKTENMSLLSHSLHSTKVDLKLNVKTASMERFIF